MNKFFTTWYDFILKLHIIIFKIDFKKQIIISINKIRIRYTKSYIITKSPLQIHYINQDYSKIVFRKTERLI